MSNVVHEVSLFELQTLANLIWTDLRRANSMRSSAATAENKRASTPYPRLTDGANSHRYPASRHSADSPPGYVDLEVSLAHGLKFKTRLIVAPLARYDMIIGLDIIERFQISLLFKPMRLTDISIQRR